MKIVTVVGARPQFVKAAIGARVIRKFHNEILVHTGQHFDDNMSKIFFDEMNIPIPDYNLGISGGSHASMTAKMLVGIEDILIKEMPDALLVYGDTNSTLAGALVAVKLHIPVIHIEAGNRLGTIKNPEEVNRIITDHISTLNFAATQKSLLFLQSENLGNNSYNVGNIMYDAYMCYSNYKPNFDLLVDFDNKSFDIPNEYYYMTCHREENTYDDKPLTEILKAMNTLDSPTIYPVHPRNKERAFRVCKNNNFSNIKLIKPVGYIESLYLTNHAKKIVTDSGGLQCEAFFAEKQCVTVFERVVWPETMVNYRNQLAHVDCNDIIEKLSVNQKIDKSYKPFGDGHAAEKIIRIINEYNFKDNV